MRNMEKIKYIKGDIRNMGKIEDKKNMRDIRDIRDIKDIRD